LRCPPRLPSPMQAPPSGGSVFRPRCPR
jgi:hypothetical protein